MNRSYLADLALAAEAAEAAGSFAEAKLLWEQWEDLRRARR